jgi:hypothetical protein
MTITRGKIDVVLDLAGQTITGERRFDNCDGVTVTGGEFVGTGTDYGLRFVRCKRVNVRGVTLRGHRCGITASDTDGFTVEECAFSAMASDGIVMAECVNILIRRNLFRDFAPSPLAHPDAIQFAKGVLGNRNVTVEQNSIIGRMQGVFGQLENGVIRRNLIRNGFPNAIAVTGRGALELRDNSVSTAAGSATQSRIKVATRTDPSSGAIVPTYSSLARAGNTVAAYLTKRDLSDIES